VVYKGSDRHLVSWDFANLAVAKDIQTGKLLKLYAHYEKP